MWQIVSCEGVDPPFNIYYSQFITWRATVKVVELYASPALLDTHGIFIILFCPRFIYWIYTWDSLLPIFYFPTFISLYIYIY